MSALHVSYGLLWALVLAQALVLYAILRDTVWLKRMYEDHRRRRSSEPRRHGQPAPEFDLPLRGSDRRLTRDELRGRETVLLFLSPLDRVAPRQLEATVHGLWHKLEGRLFLVWVGDAESCGEVGAIADAYGVPVALDRDGRVAQGFAITTTPSAVQLDEEARVSRYGRMLPGDAQPEAGPDAAPAPGHGHGQAPHHDHAHASSDGLGDGTRPPSAA